MAREPHAVIFLRDRSVGAALTTNNGETWLSAISASISQETASEFPSMLSGSFTQENGVLAVSDRREKVENGTRFAKKLTVKVIP